MIHRQHQRIAVFAACFTLSIHVAALAQTAPTVPGNLSVPEGHSVYLKTSATGTQNYVCLPGAQGPAWTFLGPQATLFVTFPWIQGDAKVQAATHFLSANPSEAGTARPTWQSSFDTSAVWGRAIANSTDPAFVAPGAIPWLLVQIAGTQQGPMGGSTLTQTTYLHRVKTSGGISPIPYTTDYYFYRESRRK